jgi:hypothetical protein
MAWPQSQDYNEAIQNPATSFGDAELRGGQAVTNALGMPMPRSGNFADVYEYHGASGQKWAIKCFTRRVPGLQERYAEISRCLAQLQLRFTVDFTYLPKGIRIRGEFYPILKMQWVEGLLLNEFARANLDKPDLLDRLGGLWVRLSRRLAQAGIAHADLQHGNIILIPGSKAARLAVKLIDYDGMWVPALAHKPSGEVGHPAYQHSERSRKGIYNAEVDRLPLLAIACALRCLAVRGKRLWDKYDNGDNMLFREGDLRQPAASALFKELWQINDPAAHDLTGYLTAALTGAPGQVPMVHDLVTDEGIRPLATQQEQQVAALLGPGAVVNRAAAVTTAIQRRRAVGPTAATAAALVSAGPDWSSLEDDDETAPRPARRPAPTNSHKVWLGIAAAVGVCVVGGLGFWALRTGEPPKGQEVAAAKDNNTKAVVPEPIPTPVPPDPDPRPVPPNPDSKPVPPNPKPVRPNPEPRPVPPDPVKPIASPKAPPKVDGDRSVPPEDVLPHTDTTDVKDVRPNDPTPPEGVLPRGADGRALNLDFETGTLKDWTAEGDAFVGQPVRDDTVFRRRADNKSQHQGNYWIGGFELRGDKPQGTLTSAPFEVTHPWGSFLVGGGSYEVTCVELVRQDSGKVFHRASGLDEENLRREVVDLKPHFGKKILIRLVDKHTGNWGHINFDDFRFHTEKPNFPLRIKRGASPPPTIVKQADPPVVKPAPKPDRPPIKITAALWKKKLAGNLKYDPKTGVLSVSYDLKSPAQLRDFELENAKADHKASVLNIDANGRAKHAVRFKEVLVTGYAIVKSANGKLIASSEGANISVSPGMQQSTPVFWLNSENSRVSGISLGLKDPQVGTMPVAMTIQGKLLRGRFGNYLREGTTEKPAGFIEFHGGAVGYGYGQLTLAGTVDEEWAQEFFAAPAPEPKKTGAAPAPPEAAIKSADGKASKFKGAAISLSIKSTSAKYEGELNEKDLLVGERYYKVFTIKLEAGKTYRIVYRGAKPGYDAYLYLEDANGMKLAEDDDGGNGKDGGGRLDSRIVHTAARTGVYRIITTTLPARQSGSFTLQVTAARAKE